MGVDIDVNTQQIIMNYLLILLPIELIILIVWMIKSAKRPKEQRFFLNPKQATILALLIWIIVWAITFIIIFDLDIKSNSEFPPGTFTLFYLLPSIPFSLIVFNIIATVHRKKGFALEFKKMAGLSPSINILDLCKRTGISNQGGKSAILKLLRKGEIIGRFDEPTWTLVIGKDALKTAAQQNEDALKAKNRLVGMIKSYGEIDFKLASESMGLPENAIKDMILETIGEGKIEGAFQENKFVFTGNMQGFIDKLNSSFADWADKEQTKVGKK